MTGLQTGVTDSAAPPTGRATPGVCELPGRVLRLPAHADQGRASVTIPATSDSVPDHAVSYAAICPRFAPPVLAARNRIDGA